MDICRTTDWEEILKAAVKSTDGLSILCSRRSANGCGQAEGKIKEIMRKIGADTELRSAEVLSGGKVRIWKGE